jgi:hypothetical protein
MLKNIENSVVCCIETEAEIFDKKGKGRKT